ncbi:chemotaxis protein CheX [Candidatus Haliotispira prima]|uniref:Chemotaxis protein CheX n=1 Tax=Candidatus Haliotispira prima TaxID=3034016 RepID=A0ABY8MGF4_9SPIO|nr:chemotaxis protein CheX [Candidatus Haliotispira prima]
MRVEYISPFVKAAYSIMCDFLGEDRVSRGKVYLRKQDTQKIMGLVAVIGLTGRAEGRVLLGMEERTALNIANAINGEEFIEVNEMVQATIQEIANMLTGRAITELHEMGFVFDITPPAIFMGKEMSMASASQEILILPLETELGLVDVSVSIFDKVARTE